MSGSHTLQPGPPVRPDLQPLPELSPASEGAVITLVASFITRVKCRLQFDANEKVRARTEFAKSLESKIVEFEFRVNWQMSGIYDPLTGKLAADYAGEVKLALDNLAAIAKAAGMRIANLVWMNLYWRNSGNPTDSREMSKTYATYVEFRNTRGGKRGRWRSLPAILTLSSVASRALIRQNAKLADLSLKYQTLPPAPVFSMTTLTTCQIRTLTSRPLVFINLT